MQVKYYASKCHNDDDDDTQRMWLYNMVLPSAVFLIPYVIMLLCTGLPIFFMELVLGQYTGLGPSILFPNMAPILAGK